MDAVLQVAEKKNGDMKADIEMIEIIKKKGKSLDETELINRMVIDKEVVHAAMPRSVEGAKIALVNAAIEVEKTEFDAEIKIESPDQIKAFLDEEERMLKTMVDKVIDSGANVLVCQNGIDDVAQHYLATNGILAVRRIKKSDVERIHKSTGAVIVSKIQNITAGDLGKAKTVEQRDIGDDKMLFVEGTPKSSVATIIVRGGTDHIVDEVDRALNDALYVTRDVVIHPEISYGGGALACEICQNLRDYASELEGREQYAVNAFADAVESIPATLAENAGLDPIDIIVDLRSAHAEGKATYGVDIGKGKVGDMKSARVLEPSLVSKQIVMSAAEAAQMILKIDDVISSKGGGGMGGPPGGPGGMDDDE